MAEIKSLWELARLTENEPTPAKSAICVGVLHRDEVRALSCNVCSNLAIDIIIVCIAKNEIAMCVDCADTLVDTTCDAIDKIRG
jgi:hypothetical protein